MKFYKQYLFALLLALPTPTCTSNGNSTDNNELALLISLSVATISLTAFFMAMFFNKRNQAYLRDIENAINSGKEQCNRDFALIHRNAANIELILHRHFHPTSQPPAYTPPEPAAIINVGNLFLGNQPRAHLEPERSALILEPAPRSASPILHPNSIPDESQ